VILAGHDDHGQYRPYGAFGVDDRQQLTRLATACGLQAVYPQGMYRTEKVWQCSFSSIAGKKISMGAVIKV